MIPIFEPNFKIFFPQRVYKSKYLRNFIMHQNILNLQKIEKQIYSKKLIENNKTEIIASKTFK